MSRRKKPELKHFCIRCNKEIPVVDNVLRDGLCVSCFIYKTTKDERYNVLRDE